MDSSTEPVPGLVVGIVSDLNDPQRLGRVRMTFPDLGGAQSDWARVVAPSAGKDRGAVFRPERGDEVMVAFERGDMRAPYVLGGVWSQPDPPPKDDGDPVANNWRFIRSRSGHLLRFDDTPGAERVEISDKDGARTVVLDSANKKVTVTATTGDVEVSAGSGTVRLAATNIEVKATQSLLLHADGAVRITGQTIDIN
jgi:uncharacterized protein involved in type VI secretion and phage assembly